VYQAGTLSANPVAMAAGLATLRKLEGAPPYAALEQRTQRLGSAIEAIARERDWKDVHVQSFGSLFWPVLGPVRAADGVVRSVAGIPPTQRERFARLFHALLERGVYLAPSGFEVGFMSTAHGDDEIERTLAAFRGALEVVRP
jgi:glutamate-1-semialdehyde 2,1-aminomutase